MSENKDYFVGKFPIRQELLILPADEIKKTNWLENSFYFRKRT